MVTKQYKPNINLLPLNSIVIYVANRKFYIWMLNPYNLLGGKL
jgi:hypothetical protein